MDKLIVMPDGREINETERLQTIKEIRKTGVCGHHISALCLIFDAKENECQVALNITKVTWNRLAKTIGQISDPSLSMLIVWFLTHPEEWPVKYRAEPNIEKIDNYFAETANLSMLVGRSGHAIYRWRERPPSDHVKLLLLIIQSAITMIQSSNTDDSEYGNARLSEFLDIARAEAARRKVNMIKDRTWIKRK